MCKLLSVIRYERKIKSSILFTRGKIVEAMPDHSHVAPPSSTIEDWFMGTISVWNNTELIK